MPPVERLDPKNDLVFKILLSSSEDILIALLSAVLRPPIPIRSALVQNPGLPKDFPDDKGSFLDVHVLLDDGSRVDVEMQCSQHPTFRGRALYYWSQLFSVQLEAGEGYERLAAVVSILFLDYREFAFARYHEVFRLLGEQTGAHFSPLLEIHTIELPKLPAQTGGDPLARWGRFFASTDRDELRRLAEEDPMIQKAEKKLVELSADERLRQELLERKRREVAHRLMLGGAYQAGREEGLAEGEAKGRLVGERLLLQKQLTLKFGPLPEGVAQLIERAGEAELNLWAERVLAAATLLEVFASPP
jgi:predicted transposase/invertase (TIGR01784 family)